MNSWNFQTNIKWSNNSMGHSGDTLGEWGCLTTSTANIYQSLKGIEYTPGDMNNRIKGFQGYYGLSDPDNWKGLESVLNWTYVKNNFLDLKIDTRLALSEYIERENTLYIARVKYRNAPHNTHYINVIRFEEGNKFKCFDTYDGVIYKVPHDEIDYFHRIALA